MDCILNIYFFIISNFNDINFNTKIVSNKKLKKLIISEKFSYLPKNNNYNINFSFNKSFKKKIYFFQSKNLFKNLKN